MPKQISKIDVEMDVDKILRELTKAAGLINQVASCKIHVGTASLWISFEALTPVLDIGELKSLISLANRHNLSLSIGRCEAQNEIKITLSSNITAIIK